MYELKMSYLQSSKGNWEPEVGDREGGSLAAEIGQHLIQVDLRAADGTTELLLTLIFKPVASPK
jgi:hypothetical protein